VTDVAVGHRWNRRSAESGVGEIGIVLGSGDEFGAVRRNVGMHANVAWDPGGTRHCVGSASIVLEAYVSGRRLVVGS
jgi:hypothetical protein